MINPSHLMELNLLARQEGQHYPKKRNLYSQLLASRSKHFIGIVGPRGVGKTVLLRQIANQVEDSFYLSADTLLDEDLFEIVKRLNSDYGVNLFLIDEVHFNTTIDAVLKKIYDFLDVRVIFTSSVALAMFESSYDLSRRVRLLNLLPFSFREYLFFTRDTSLSAL